MYKIYLTDPKFRRMAILYEFHTGNPIFKCFDDMCDRMGHNFMDYREFEFWFQRFASGNFDIDYDMSREPPTRQFLDLPISLFERIAKNLEPFSRLLLRKVCKSFRALVDNWEPRLERNETSEDSEDCNGLIQDSNNKLRSEFVKRIRVRVDQNAVVLSFNRNHWQYCHVSEESCVVRYSREGKFDYEGNHEDVAIDDLVSVLCHSKLRLSSFTITSGFWTPPGIAKGFWTKLMQKLEKSNRNARIHAEEVSISCAGFIDKLRMLKFFNPETVKTSKFEGSGDAIVPLQSWKKLDEIRTKPNILGADKQFSIQGNFKNSSRNLLRHSPIMCTPYPNENSNRKSRRHSCKENAQISRPGFRRCLPSCS